MTTPAHCTRTDPHPEHPLTAGWLCPGIHPGVEPPADVAATPDPWAPQHDAWCITDHVPTSSPCPSASPDSPDPRLDVVTSIINTTRGRYSNQVAQRILDKLDAMRPDDERTLSESYHAGWIDGRNRGQAMRPDETSIHTFVAGEGWTEEQSFTPAPAGLSAAQEIRLRLVEALFAGGGEVDSAAEGMILRFAAMIEHGPDETPDSDRMRWRTQVDRLAQFIINNVPGEPSRSEGAVDTAVRLIALYQARLGHIKDALRDYAGQSSAAFLNALQEILDWTPAGTATADDRPTIGDTPAPCMQLGCGWVGPVRDRRHGRCPEHATGDE